MTSEQQSSVDLQDWLGEPDSVPPARYEQVKLFIRQKLRSGEWRSGDKIPSENELVKVLGVARMTINRAVRELSEQGELIRRGGVGTFVAEPRPHSTLLTIARIGDEIAARGNEYRWTVLWNRAELAGEATAEAMGIPRATRLFHLRCIHCENGVPVQLEDRFVNPACVPGFLEQTFEAIPPSQYLLDVIPAAEVEHMVDAVLALDEADLLQVPRLEPCLLLTRRTWAGTTPVTLARLLHPSSRYRLGCRFKASFMQHQS